MYPFLEERPHPEVSHSGLGSSQIQEVAHMEKLLGQSV